MKETGMLFKTPLVRALLDGTKTQTRRVMKRQPHEEWVPAGYGELHGFDKHGELKPDKVIGWGAFNEDGDEGYCCPYGKPGDRIWVRENFAFTDDHYPEFEGAVEYQADGKSYAVQGRELYDVPSLLDPWDGPWKPSIHMPRWASRILLEITSVRVERLQDISDTDIQAEGVKCELAEGRFSCLGGKYLMPWRSKWRDLWESTGGDWDANPWLWAITFKRVTP